MKSGLSRPTAENAHLRPFQISAPLLGVLRRRAPRRAATRAMTAISCADSASTCARSPSSSTSSTAAASRG